MSSNILEQIRQRLEDIDHIKKAIVTTIEKKTESSKQGVANDHRVNNLLTMIQLKSMDILKKTNDEGLKSEIALKKISNKEFNSSRSIWERLESDLGKIEDYHDTFIPESVQAPSYSKDYYIEAAFQPPYKRPQFSAKEHEGKAIDSQLLFQKYFNMTALKEKGILFKDTLQFMRNFERIFDVGLDVKMKSYSKFKEFYHCIDVYLKDFFRKVQPLVDFDQVNNKIQDDFEKKKHQKTLKGYYEYEDIAPVNKLTEDTAKNETAKQRLYCDVCQCVFSNENVFVHHFNGKKHKKNKKNMGKILQRIDQEKELHKIVAEKENRKKDIYDKKKYQLAKIEHSICQFKGLLVDVFDNTLNFLRRQQTYNLDELSEENSIKSDEELILSEEEEENYNPKNLPIGWDGKPIPYWLFKLHGLGIEYKCEICGNYSYWGRRAFEKHFTEWRHTYAMKCLKIPNSVHFREITNFNDALILHHKLLEDSKKTKFNPDVEEEFEDSEGNVLDKRTYIDLQKQGLL